VIRGAKALSNSFARRELFSKSFPLWGRPPLLVWVWFSVFLGAVGSAFFGVGKIGVHLMGFGGGVENG